jgi:1-acyl-sn-glycerol-3-phosphate acyltransferase
MKKSRFNLLKSIGGIWFAIGFASSFLALYPLFVITLSRKQWYPAAHKLRRYWAWWLFVWGGIRVKQIEEVKINPKRAYVIAPNHSSQLDIVTLGGKLKLYFNFMAKNELAKIPLFGIFFRTIDIAVERKNSRKAAQAYQKSVQQLKHGQSIVIFPEGTIPHSAPKLGKFKEGAFKLAIETQTDILPVTIIGNWKRLPDKGRFHFIPGKVIHYVHAPVSTYGMSPHQVNELMEHIRQLHENKLAEYGY